MDKSVPSVPAIPSTFPTGESSSVSWISLHDQSKGSDWRGKAMLKQLFLYTDGQKKQLAVDDNNGGSAQILDMREELCDCVVGTNLFFFKPRQHYVLEKYRLSILAFSTKLLQVCTYICVHKSVYFVKLLYVCVGRECSIKITHPILYNSLYTCHPYKHPSY